MGLPKPFDISIIDKEKFMSKINKTETCWLWVGTKTVQGYGAFYTNGRNLKPHRVSYLLFKGPLDCTLVIDHLCRNRICVNPDHLEQVSEIENIYRGTSFAARNKSKTHCYRGHPLTDDNLNNKRKGGRECIKCTKIFAENYVEAYRPCRKKITELKAEIAKLEALVREAEPFARHTSACTMYSDPKFEKLAEDWLQRADKLLSNEVER